MRAEYARDLREEYHSADNGDAEWVRKVTFNGRALAIRREQDRRLAKGAQ